jgi:outer membrane lipoprotein-sorting protein
MKTKESAAKKHKMRKIFLSSCAFLWLIPAAQAQSALTLNQVFAKMDEVAKTFHSVQADLERTHVTVAINDKDVDTGKFYYERPAKELRVRMDLTKSDEHLLIDKGKWQLYQARIKEVQQGLLKGHEDQIGFYTSLGFGQSSQELKENFDISLVGDETIDGRKTTILELKPKSTKGFKSYRLWVDQQHWVTYQLRATEKSNDYFLLKYPNAKVNAGIPASTFDLKLPKNVNVQK